MGGKTAEHVSIRAATKTSWDAETNSDSVADRGDLWGARGGTARGRSGRAR